VTLEPGSRLYYAASFAGNKREVELIGKAFFQVERMPAKPFYVYTGKVVTQVLGTSFRVSTQGAGDQVDVEVVTGRVSVYERLGKAQARVNNGVILAPNHKATYFAQNQHFITGLVDAPALLATESAKDTVARFVYDDTPIRDVVKQLETAYGINIALEDNQLSECPITADISNKPLYSQLDIICAALQATYAVQGTTILISGKGCQK
jgi:ferric-dicitrate binding protein FerR (iron transport regulator)